MVKANSKTEGIIVTMLILISFILAVFWPCLWLLKNNSTDLPSYYFAGYTLMKGGNPYRHAEMKELASQAGFSGSIWPYIYFPLTAMIFMPLSSIPFQTVQLIWFAVSQICFWLSLAVLYQITCRCYPSDPKSFFKRYIYMVPLTCLFFPLIMNFQHGQINTIILFFVCAFIYLLMTDSEMLAGFVLALVISIKPPPAIILPYLWFKKRFRCFWSTVISFVAITCLTIFITGWENFWFYLINILPSFCLKPTKYTPVLLNNPGNQSLQGIISRLYEATKNRWSIWGGTDHATVVSHVLLFIVMAIGFYRLYTWNRNKSATDRALLRDCSYVLIMSVLLSPIAWDHHLVIIFPIVAYLLFEKPNKFWKTLPGFMMFFCWTLMAIELYVYHPIWKQNIFASHGISIKGFASLGFWILLTIYG